ncbi:MAG: histidine kinase [Flammeovirgaceae bacterium]|nr:histidine kinase [Flammeovirgaceae bacterium]
MVNKHRLYWTLQISGWLTYAMLQMGGSIIQSADQQISNRRVLFFLLEATICLFITHGFRLFLNRGHWLDLGMRRLIPKVIAGVFILSLIVYFVRVPVSLSLGISFDPETVFDLGQILGLSSIYAFIFFVWSVFYFTYHYFERYNTSLKYEAYMKEIELNNLKSQLNPHFIFNALNSIRALVDENPLKSKQAINQLSNILRTSLTFDKKGLAKFDDELKMVKDYLGLESIRFEERLKTEFDIHPDSHDFYVPPLMIQTLVENGIKHGISKLTGGGVIQLKTSIDNDRLKIHIRNSGHLHNGAKRSKKGLGIENTRQRLKLIYGDEAQFKMVNEGETFVLTELIIPQKKYESINRR